MSVCTVCGYDAIKAAERAASAMWPPDPCAPRTPYQLDQAEVAATIDRERNKFEERMARMRAWRLQRRPMALVSDTVEWTR